MKVCNSCGANNDDAAVACSVCGEAFAASGFVTGGDAMTFAEPTYAQPQSSKKGKLFIILGVIALVAVVAIALILLLGGKGGAKSPEEATKIYLEGIEDGDADKMLSVAAPFASKEDKEALSAVLGMMEGFDVKVEYIGLNDEEELDVEEIQDDIKARYGKSVKIDEAMKAEAEYEMNVTVFGETTSEITTEYLTFIKYKGKWYIYF